MKIDDFKFKITLIGIYLDSEGILTDPRTKLIDTDTNEWDEFDIEYNGILILSARYARDQDLVNIHDAVYPHNVIHDISEGKTFCDVINEFKKSTLLAKRKIEADLFLAKKKLDMISIVLNINVPS